MVEFMKIPWTLEIQLMATKNNHLLGMNKKVRRAVFRKISEGTVVIAFFAMLAFEFTITQ
jgi:hypothetical protein